MNRPPTVLCKDTGVAPAVMTVTGAAPGGELGPTLAHEHLHADLSAVSGKDDNIMTDVETAIDELSYFVAAGGRTIIEVTPTGVGRNPAALRRMSLASGVRIVSGIAFYTQATAPGWALKADENELAAYFVRHLDEGEDGVRAGVIGELYSHNAPGVEPDQYRLDAFETRAFRAAALAQQSAGVAVITHASYGRGGLAQLDALEAAGADLTRVAIGHCDAVSHEDPAKDLSYYLRILERGALCAFDLLGWEELMPDERRADRLAELIRRGYAGRVVLGSDTCRRSQLRANNGRGYDAVWTRFLPRLRRRGVSEKDIETMLVHSPRKLLTGT